MSTPPFEPDDPRLTAYALGEADENVRRAVENRLAESAEVRAEVEQTRAFALALTAEYARENERYLASRPDTALVSNLVVFPVARMRRWPRAMSPLLKIAAVLALTASVIYLGLRRSHPPSTATVASAPPDAPLAASPPSPVAAGPVPQDADAAGAGNKDRAAPGSLDAVHPPQDATGRVADVPATSPDPLLAMHREQELAGAGEQASDRIAMEPAPQVSMMRREAPAMVSAAARSAARPAKPASSDEQITRSTVRVRCSDGRFFGGVIVSPGGLILAATTLPESALRQPCTVLLADRNEMAATVERSPLGAGWYWLRVRAIGLSAAPFATNPPADGAALTVPVVDQASGKLRISHVLPSAAAALKGRRLDHADRSLIPTSATVFAFDPAGELMVFERPGLLSSGKEKATSGATSAVSAARPFTAAELESLRKAIELDEKQ